MALKEAIGTNPARTPANLAESRAPWARTTRPLRGR